MLKKSLLSVAALLAATMLSATAQASTVDLNYVSPNTTVTTSVSVVAARLTLTWAAIIFQLQMLLVLLLAFV